MYKDIKVIITEWNSIACDDQIVLELEGLLEEQDGLSVVTVRKDELLKKMNLR